MKKITLLLVALLTFGGILTAQSAKEELDLMQAAFGIEKKSMVSDFVRVDPAQKDAFWKLYDEYETTRKSLGVKRVELLKKYADNYDKLTIEFADSWSKEVLDLTKKNDGLLITYFNKIKKATNSVVALQFYQVESYILAGIRLSLLEELPLPDLKK
jgi:hypothetical protein